MNCLPVNVLECMVPHVCKYCGRLFADTSQYMFHKRCHERRMRTYWYQNKQRVKNNTTSSTCSRVCNFGTNNQPFGCPKVSMKLRSDGGGSTILFKDDADDKNVAGILNKRSIKTHRQYSDSAPSRSTLSATSPRASRGMHIPENPYQCKYCQKTFSSRSTRIVHERIHSKEKPYQCQYCSVSFAQMGNKNKHERIHTKEISYRCKYCSLEFAQVGKRNRHELNHSTGKQCGYKSRSSTLKKAAQEDTIIQNPCNVFGDKHGGIPPINEGFKRTDHKRNPSKTTGYRCKQSTKHHESPNDLLESKHDRVKKYPCKHCNMIFSDENKKNIHILSIKHISLPSNRSRQNSKQTTNSGEKSAALDQRHSSTSPSEKGYNAVALFQCKASNKASPRADTMHTHQLSYAKDTPRECKQFTKSLATESAKTKHERTTTKQKLYKCQFCNRAFTQAGHKSLHERIHTKENPYLCNTCNKTFTRSDTLKVHLRTHTKQADRVALYQCQYCNKSHSTSSQKTSHERTHTNVKPYHCQYCSDRFSHKSSKTVHERTHTKEKPYKCSYCDKAFYRTFNKTIHERVHTKEKPYRCTFCSKSFSRVDSKASHEKNHTK